MDSEANVSATFERRRAVVWVCDIQGSSSALNDVQRAPAAEEFLQRFFWLSSVLARTSGGLFSKWTGDGFVAAYDVPLDRDAGAAASVAIEAAWHPTFLVNLTQLGVATKPPFRVRHGIAYEPDAIIVRHKVGADSSTDIIGRAVVLAFRLSGIRCAFPGIVAQQSLVDAAREAGCSQRFRRLLLSPDNVLKYFKGERWATKALCASDDRPPRRRFVSIGRQLRAAIAKAEGTGPIEPRKAWLDTYLKALSGGPKWAREAAKEEARFVRDDLLGGLKKLTPLLRGDVLGGLEKLAPLLEEHKEHNVGPTGDPSADRRGRGGRGPRGGNRLGLARRGAPG